MENAKYIGNKMKFARECVRERDKHNLPLLQLGQEFSNLQLETNIFSKFMQIILRQKLNEALQTHIEFPPWT